MAARLIYSAIASLDGYTEDADGKFDFARPSRELHGFVNELERPIGTYLYGRRMYETMAYWETAHTLPDQRPVSRDYTEIWQAADKVVYSRTLTSAQTARTRIEPEFDPAAVRDMKAATKADISIGGPELAAEALRAGLVDELSLFLNPILIGGGKPALPDGVRIGLELLDERRFENGAVYVRYAIAADPSD